jgi:hypothetical protein
MFHQVPSPTSLSLIHVLNFNQNLMSCKWINQWPIHWVWLGFYRIDYVGGQGKVEPERWVNGKSLKGGRLGRQHRPLATACLSVSLSLPSTVFPYWTSHLKEQKGPSLFHLHYVSLVHSFRGGNPVTIRFPPGN